MNRCDRRLKTTIGHENKNNDSIHLVGDNEKSAYCCKYDNSNSSIICTVMKCSELTETSFVQGTHCQRCCFYLPANVNQYEI